MDVEIIKTDDPNIVIERTFTEREIDLQAIRDLKEQSIALVKQFTDENNLLQSSLTGTELIDNLIFNKIEENKRLIEGFEMDIYKCSEAL